MVLIAKQEPGGCGGLEWTAGGDDGAIEVSPRDASVLLGITGNDFYEVAAKDVKKEAKPTAPAAKAKKVVDAEAKVGDDLTEALNVADSTVHKPKE